MFDCLCWNGDKNFPPPAATVVAPPETTAGGGVASSAPHPFTLHPFQASTCPEMCPGSQTPPSQCTTAPQNWRGRVENIGPSSLLLLRKSWSQDDLPMLPSNSMVEPGCLEGACEGRRSHQPGAGTLLCSSQKLVVLVICLCLLPGQNSASSNH